MTQQRVFVDANVVIEAFRIGAWSDISQGCHLETVEEVVKESLTGSSSTGHVAINGVTLTTGLKAQYQVSRAERNKLLSDHVSLITLDPGEKDLLAHLYAQGKALSSVIVISSADKGAIVAVSKLGWLDSVESLEALLRKAHVSHAKIGLLQAHYTDAFLQTVRTKILLGVIP